MKSIGQIAYEAYCDHTCWKSVVDGDDLPKWCDVNVDVKAAWEDAASAVWLTVKENEGKS